MHDSINRVAVIVWPAEPFIEWASTTDDGAPGAAKGLREEAEPTIYLADVDERDADGSMAIARNWSVIFEAELNGWYRDESVWPADRTEEMFRQWFRVSWGSMLVDLSDDELDHNDW